MKKLSVIFSLLCLTVAVQAQTITRSYNRQPLSAVLIDLNNAGSRYHIHFVYDELEDFTVTCSFRKKSLPDAVRAVVGFYPAVISYDGDNIFVECVEKEKTKLSGRLVDTRDRPIGYANVTLLSPEDSSVVAGGVTTPDGDFVVPCRLREVIARFSIVGYATRHQRLSVGSVGNVVLQEVQYPIAPVEVQGAKSFTHTFADLRRDMRKSEVSEDSIAPMTERLMLAERRLRFNDRPKAAIYECLLAQMGVDSIGYRRLALSDMDALACARARDYKDVVDFHPYGKYFNDDLLSVIGYHLGAYDELFNYYSAHGNRSAALLVELERNARSASVSPATAASQYDCLDSLMTVYGDLDVSTEIAIARYQLMENDRQSRQEEKASYLEQTMNRFPHNKRSQWLRNKYEELITPRLSLSLASDLLTTADSLSIALVHRHAGKVKVNVYAIDGSGWDTDDISAYYSGGSRKDFCNDHHLTRLGKLSQRLTFEEPHPYSHYRDTVTLPSLPVGIYCLEVETKAGRSYKKFHVSDVRPILLPAPDDSAVYVSVVNAITGHPVPFAKVQFDDDSIRVADSRGEVLISDDETIPDEVFAFTDADRACMVTDVHCEYDTDGSHPDACRLALLTDRSVYRPGQTVHAAAVLYSLTGDDTHTVAGREVTITLANPQGKSVASHVVTTDDFGTASVDITLPVRHLGGTYRLRASYTCSDRRPAYAHQTLKVDEYKRPTFTVELDDCREVLSLGDTLRLHGRAKTMTGDAVKGATVAFRVRGQQGSGSFCDRRDTLAVDANGDFTIVIPTPAPPQQASRSGAPKSYAYASYFVNATVTDVAGESHDANKSLWISNKPATLSCSLPDKQAVHRDALRSGNYTFRVSNSMRREVEEEVVWWLDGDSRRHTVVSGNPIVFDRLDDMANGAVTLHAVCRGDTIHRTFYLFDWTLSRPPVFTDDWFVASAAEFPADGKPVIVQVGSSRSRVHVLYAVCRSDSILERGTFMISDSVRRRDFSYRPEYGDGITLLYAWYQDGRFHHHRHTIAKPLPDKQLSATWNTFRDRLMPGQQEEWQLTLTTPDGRPADAQLMATLYDKSLDEFRRHDWRVPLGLDRELADVNFTSVEVPYTPAGTIVKSFRARPVGDMLVNRFDFGLSGIRMTVSGQVVDNTGEPVIGATVMVGKKAVAVTDLDGRYSVMAASGEQLSFSYIGYLEKTLRVMSRHQDVTLQEDENRLDEVVVVGYGTAKKKNFTGSTIRVRGASTISAASHTLYVVDGRIVDDISNIDAADIVSMDVLKGSDATAVYGARAAEGVVVVTTRQGSAQLSGTEQEAFLAMSARENLNETAFFYPRLSTDGEGRVTIRFTLPESVTTWRFLGYAHTRDMNQTVVSREAVARKELMVQPNMPRFIREGDNATITARVSNLSDRELSGTAVMMLLDPATSQVVLSHKQAYRVKGGDTGSVVFSLPATLSSLLSPHSSLQETPSLLVCRIVATSGTMSDGEQHYLPLLPAGEYMTTTVPMTHHAAGTYRLDLSSLFPREAVSPRLTVEYTNNPAWLMVQALHEYAHPHDACAICQAVAYFSQRVGSHLVESTPGVANAIEAWTAERDTLTAGAALTSPLERNADVKSVLLEETPWTVTADTETGQMDRLADFLRKGELWERSQKAVAQLLDMQHADGSWGWFKGMAGNRLVTAVVAEQLVRTNRMTGRKKETQLMLDRAFGWLARGGVDMSYLYLSALDGRQLPDSVSREARRMIRDLKRDKHPGNIYTMAQSVVVLHHYGHKQAAAELLDSILAWTVSDEVRGRYFDTNRAPYSWLDYRIPSQVRVIEALQLVRPDDRRTIGEMQRWLLQEKRTQYWLTEVNSADAIYAFLNGNRQLLSDTARVAITVDGHAVADSTLASGLGYVRQSLSGSGVSRLEVSKPDDTTSWGAVYAQYFLPSSSASGASSSASRTAAAAGESPLTVRRELIVGGRKVSAQDARQLPLRVGDKVRVRITLTASRDLDFVQVVDRRAACLEPVDALSGYRRGCYQDNRDTSTRYFIDMLPKGKRVIEQEFYVDRPGTYESGTVSAQCAYAPEYSATAGRMVVIVK